MQTAVITGAASGLGAALAAQCAADGMRVVLADIDEDGGERQAQKICGLGGEAWFCRTDITDPTSVAQLAEEVFVRYGAVDILFNNAGVLKVAALQETTDADWLRILNLNLLGTARVVRAFVAKIRATGRPARIVNISSLSGLTPALEVPIGAYVVSKSALISFSEVLRHELLADGISVAVVCPGGIATDIFAADGIPMTADGERVLPPALVAQRIMEGLTEGRFYIFTHPAEKTRIEERFNEISGVR